MHRKELDLIDNAIIDILADRMTIAEAIGRLKHKENVAILQSGRWADILSAMIQTGADKGLSREFVEEIFKAIHVESINIQHNIKL